MHTRYLEGGVGPFEVSAEQAKVIIKRWEEEVSPIEGMPVSIGQSSPFPGERGLDTVDVAPITGGIGWCAKNMEPTLPEETRQHFKKIVEEVIGRKI